MSDSKNRATGLSDRDVLESKKKMAKNKKRNLDFSN